MYNALWYFGSIIGRPTLWSCVVLTKSVNHSQLPGYASGHLTGREGLLGHGEYRVLFRPLRLWYKRY